ncbi:hypothetical protein Ddye_031212 [Dipteronia dyeriana]|uniref:Pectinesterase n=1 Tax=Dipteronia dyeriana TaxID=168575 RepID=A0AAD9WNH1_9ROSI|nr:hypothetical protein Ddye_031212 [Dipteronia dyeriana]
MVSLSFLNFTFSNLSPNITVAQDGTGDVRSIGEAVQAAPNNNNFIFTIYIKEGMYYENIRITREKKNLVIYGDGMNNTIIISNRSNSSGFGIQDSATLDVSTDYFLAKNIGIVNYAGPEGNQAVALRVSGIYHYAFYNCSIMGYQDTLYMKEGNIFFRECKIYGTVDFIFGDAAGILQNSFIYARRPIPGQQNVVTAQGRTKANGTAAIVIHNCTITGSPGEYDPTVITYLGRPWKTFSRTIIMQSYLDSIIDPKGWVKFNETSDLSSLYYVEYDNGGPGADTDGRVNWPGYHASKNKDDVQQFTVQKFFEDTDWLRRVDVPFTSGLL